MIVHVAGVEREAGNGAEKAADGEWASEGGEAKGAAADVQRILGSVLPLDRVSAAHEQASAAALSRIP